MKTSCLSLLSACMFCTVQAQTLEKIRSTNTITIAHRESSVPFSYLNDQKKPTGFAVELCLLVAKKVAERLSLSQIQINYVLVNPSTRIPAIEDGKADIECGSTTDNFERRKRVAFSIHYFFASIQMLVRNNAGIENWSDLDRKTVVVAKGSTSLAQIKKQASLSTVAMNIVEAQDHASAFNMLEARQADAYLSDDVVLAGLRANAPAPANYRVTGKRFTIEPYGLMLRKNDTAFKKLVDESLREAMRSGQFLALYDT
jgi:ABC-type amino acid transport substrate-binding protein